jgi:hypothetical protein
VAEIVLALREILLHEAVDEDVPSAAGAVEEL